MPGLKPFFYAEPLKNWEKRVILLYALITIMLFFWYIMADIATKRGILFIYGIGTQIGLYLALYTSLRNLKSYLIWCAFGVLHLIIYIFTINDHSLQMPRAHASSVLINTIALLLIFQFLRLASRNLQRREFVTPSRSGIDLFENRIVSGVDYFIFLTYFSAWGGLFYLSTN